jgi:adenosylcobinamide-GDP ribazoletransferase
MFLTRLPVRAPDTGLAGAAVAFPVIGLIVGALGGAAYGLGWLAGLPALACAFIGVCATAVVTGALHEDGLADMADGLAGRTKEDAIRIMRDSRTGGYGVLALIFSVGLRVAALAALADPLAVVIAMASVGALSRAAMPAVMRVLPPASVTGLAAAAGRPNGLDVFLAVGIAVLLAVVGLGPGPALVTMCAAFVAAWMAAALARRRLDGYTGDSLGAVQQATEIAGLLAIAAMM